MQYLKLQRAFRACPQWQEATNAVRGAWTALAGHCADEELGGRIRGCRTWARSWTTKCDGITADDVSTVVVAGLARWDGDDLVVEGYDLIGEQSYQATRERGRSAGKSSARIRQVEPGGQPPGSTARFNRQDEPPGPTTGSNHTVQPDAEPPGSTVGFNQQVDRQVQPILHSPLTTDQSGGSPSPVNPAREEPPLAAAALAHDQWTPETAQRIADVYGGRSELADKPLAAEWANAFAGLDLRQVQAMWLAHGEPITLPSHFRAAREEIVAAQAEAQVVAQVRAAAQVDREQAARKQAAEEESARRRHAGDESARDMAKRLLAVIDADLPRWIPALMPGTKGMIDQLRTLTAQGRVNGLLVLRITQELPEELSATLEVKELKA